MLSLPIMYFFSGNQQFIDDLVAMIDGSQVDELMIIYGIGAASIFLTLAWMYQYARKKSQELELDEIELFDTNVSLRGNLLMASVPLLSVLIILIFRSSIYVGAFGGFTYFLYTPLMFWYFNRSAKRRKKLIMQLEDSK